VRLTFKVCVKTTTELPPLLDFAMGKLIPDRPGVFEVIPPPPRCQYIIHFDVSDQPSVLFGDVVKAPLRLMTCDPECAARFERGKAYHIDFTPAE